MKSSLVVREPGDIPPGPIADLHAGCSGSEQGGASPDRVTRAHERSTPASRAARSAWRPRPVFPRTALSWLRTVSRDRPNDSAMSSTVEPSPIPRATRASAGVRSNKPWSNSAGGAAGGVTRVTTRMLDAPKTSWPPTQSAMRRRISEDEALAAIAADTAHQFLEQPVRGELPPVRGEHRRRKADQAEGLSGGAQASPVPLQIVCKRSHRVLPSHVDDRKLRVKTRPADVSYRIRINYRWLTSVRKPYAATAAPRPQARAALRRSRAHPRTRPPPAPNNRRAAGRESAPAQT